ncbi:Vitamin B12 import ATP-binding protein BtuD [subsurface metagenome]
MIELRGVTKRFGTNLAVRNFSFKCKEREFVVIFGPAGAGKSTILSMIAGITEPTYGELYYDDEPLKGVPPEKRNFSMVFENYALYPHLTNYENLAFPLRAHKVPKDEIKERVYKMARLLHIEEVLDRKPGFLSGGQRQRIALGRSLIRDAYIYLLDEPIAHLDARLRIQMRAELKNICEDKKATVLYVTHDYREAMALADRVIVVNKGRLMQDAPPEDVYNKPANEFVASFIGNPPMSFIEVKLEVRDGKPEFYLEKSEISIPASNDFNSEMMKEASEAKIIKLGLRANRTSLSRVQDEKHNIKADVYLVESQGHRNLITVKLNENIVQAISSPEQTYEVGEQVFVNIHSNILHVFADERAIYHPDIQA